MKYERFPTLAAMTARAIELLSSDSTAYLDHGIYTEGCAKRPQVFVVRDGHEDIALRWYAFADESVDHYGVHHRVDANNQAREHVNHINTAMAAIDAKADAAIKLNAKAKRERKAVRKMSQRPYNHMGAMRSDAFHWMALARQFTGTPNMDKPLRCPIAARNALLYAGQHNAAARLAGFYLP